MIIKLFLGVLIIISSTIIGIACLLYTSVEIDGQVYSIVDFQHVKPGKGAAFVRTKIKNIITGGVTERTFNPTEKFPKAHIERKEMQYLYNDGSPVSYTHLDVYKRQVL